MNVRKKGVKYMKTDKKTEMILINPDKYEC